MYFVGKPTEINKMKSETNTQINNGSIYIRVPPHLVAYLKLSKEKADDLIIQDDTGKHGDFISVWRKNQKKEA